MEASTAADGESGRIRVRERGSEKMGRDEYVRRWKLGGNFNFYLFMSMLKTHVHGTEIGKPGGVQERGGACVCGET